MQSAIAQAIAFEASSFASQVEWSKQLLELGPLALGLGEGLRMTVDAGRSLRPVLLPTDKVVEKLICARMAAEASNVDLKLIVCTEARNAVAVTADISPADRRHLSGATTIEGFPAYCGSLEAAIQRALVFARYANVVCFKSATADVVDARRFANQVRSAFPGKELGFGHPLSPEPGERNERTYGQLQAELREFGYSYYFVTHFGTTVFPEPLTGRCWALFDDLAPTAGAGRHDAADSGPKPLSDWAAGRRALRSWPARRGRFERAS